MKIFNDLNEIDINEPTAVALGTFDGFHSGHMKVLEKLQERCKIKGAKSLIFTFSNHPRGVETNSRILDIDHKIQRISEMGFDYLVMIPFDNDFKNIEPVRFVEDILIKKLKASIVAVGYNYRFGRMASGNVSLLYNYSHEFELNVISEVKYEDEEVISSTRVRELIESGEMTKVTELLGRPYRVTGKVVHGKQVGRKFGFPTANMEVNSEMTILMSGVYATKAIIDGKEYAGVTNIGKNPTVGAGGTFVGSFNVETYILDFEENIYDKTIDLEFIKYLRPEIKFDSREDLFGQISEDVDLTREIISL